MKQLDLMDAGKFTYEDLLANRQGQLTVNQRNKLWHKAIEIFIGYGIFACAGAAMLDAAWRGYQNQNGGNMVPTALMGAAFTIIFFALLIIKGQRILTDIQTGDIHFVEGKGQRGGMDTRPPTYKIIMEG